MLEIDYIWVGFTMAVLAGFGIAMIVLSYTIKIEEDEPGSDIQLH